MKWFDHVLPPPNTFSLVGDGKKQLKTIVFIHGFSSTYKLHQPFVEKFNLNNYNYFAFNLPDHNFDDWSNKIPRKFNFENYVEFAIQQIRRNVKGQIILIGHSMGGGIAAIVAERLGHQIEKLVLVSPINHAIYQSRVGLQYLFGTIFNHASEIYQIEFANYPHTPYPDYEVERYIFLKHKFLYIGTQLLNIHLMEKLRGIYQKIAVPTLVVIGTKDLVVPGKASEQFFKKIKSPHLVIQTICGAGHVPFVDHTNEYCKIMAAFLDANLQTELDNH